MPANEKRHSIGYVEKAVGLPRSTLYYYESQFPTFLRIEKTAGGHRRYTDYNIEQFRYLKEQLHEQGLSLSTVRDALMADNDPQRMRKDLDLLLKVSEELAKDNKMLKASLGQVGKRLRHLEEFCASRSKKKFLKWFE
ncbi:MAG: MerR family transcriptional regulator [Acidobacteriota bacterium]|nr:MAG: MerR family transcriptional regulator [Acidobacteriota bacterium]